jgi:hypothetical protein
MIKIVPIDMIQPPVKYDGQARMAWFHPVRFTTRLLLIACSFSPIFSRTLAEIPTMMDSPPENSLQRVGSI